jgi:hypothetical protein
MMNQAGVRRMTAELPLGGDALSVRRRVEGLERLLERSVNLPVVGRRIGLDAIVGLVPVAGDMVTAAMGLYLVWEARNLGMPKWRLMQMLANVGFDTAVGAIPVAGDLFDVLFRSNSRNLKILRRHLDKHHPASTIIEGRPQASCQGDGDAAAAVFDQSLSRCDSRIWAVYIKLTFHVHWSYG